MPPEGMLSFVMFVLFLQILAFRNKMLSTDSRAPLGLKRPRRLVLRKSYVLFYLNVDFMASRHEVMRK